MTFVELLKRYVEDYTNRHDLTVIPLIIDPAYRFTMSGQTIGYAQYLTTVEGAFDLFPDLSLVVHDLFTNGDRLAMRFSERGTSARHQRPAVWSGIALYRWNGRDRLTECIVEQDFYGRLQQLRGSPPPPLAPPMENPFAVKPMQPDPEAEKLAADYILSQSSPPFMSEGEVAIHEAFSAGGKVALRFRRHGAYLGGLVGAPNDAVGHLDFVDTNAVVWVESTGAVHCWQVSDLYGFCWRLRRSCGSSFTG
ncbi:MAG: hypothetical protein KatS3mg011_2281 [Acidimicrobiia bacterium]|nr:MAG: hypothetical protein KatS3mg011_2281 [Acidimicrobiia bacterium]